MEDVDIYEYFIDHGFSEQAYEYLPENKKLEYLDIAISYDKEKEGINFLVFSYIEYLHKYGCLFREQYEDAIEGVEAIDDFDKDLLTSYLYGPEIYETKSREIFINRKRNGL